MSRGPDPSSEQRPAITLRDAAKQRLRRTTQLSIAATIVVGGVFASLAAGSTHFTKRVVRQAHRPAKAVVQTQAPAPPLVDVRSTAPPAPSPAQPVAPTVTPQPPVVVSGGS